MNLWFIAAIAAAVTVPGAPPLPPHMHYEVRITGVERKLTDAEKLQMSCELVGAMSGRIQRQAKADPILAFDLAVLKNTTCGKSKSN